MTHAPTRAWATSFALSCALAVLAGGLARAASAPRVHVAGAERLPPYALDSLDLSKASPRPEVVAFEARGSAERGVVTSCVSLPTSGWVDEAEPVAFEKLAGIAAATVTRARGKPPAWHEEPIAARAPFPLRRALAPDAGDSADASLVIGFVRDEGRDGHEALACFAVSYGGAPSARDAHVEAPFVNAPPPGTSLRALVWSVHHPRETGALALVCGAMLAFVYLRARPRPKIARRIRSTRGT